MTNENDLMMKLVAAKQIMNKHNEMGRGGVRMENSSPMVEEFKQPTSNYNIPSEYMNESLSTGYQQTDDINHPLLSESQVKQNMSVSQPMTSDRIMSSKLPDSIKQLMMEHPISQPSNNLNGGATLSDDLIERASRLMGTQPSKQPQQNVPRQPSNNIPPSNELKSMIQEAVREVLSENGLITESVSKTNDIFSFRVGAHIFEGKVTKIKKLK